MLKFSLIGFLVFFTWITSACDKKEGSPDVGTDPVNLPAVNVNPQVEFWLTQADRNVLFKKQVVPLVFSAVNNNYNTIVVDTAQTFQTIDGFGYTLTGGSASLINSMSPAGKDAILKELFATDSTHIGVSYLRISIGASDLSAASFTYNDLPPGQTDVHLQQFSIEQEKADLIPILKMILAINPSIKILGSPWSAPVWMKTNSSFVGGSLKPEYYQVYAQYFVKYIQAMKAEGINIDAITIQNEPLHGGNNPSMVMQASDQAVFIKNHLGPAFEAASMKTKIIIWDHNADRPDYPLTVLNDPDARKYVDGSAFHLYGGSISALSQVRNAYPDKHIYFTEQWVGGPGNFRGDLKWHIQNLIIGATRNWSRNVLEWNLASDPAYHPHTKGGCSTCLGAITIGNGSVVSRNVAYYIIAHASKFARPGSVRIASSQTSTLLTVAFRNPQGQKVLIVLNAGTNQETFNIQFNGKSVATTLNDGAVGTYVW